MGGGGEGVLRPNYFFDLCRGGGIGEGTGGNSVKGNSRWSLKAPPNRILAKHDSNNTVMFQQP